MAAVGNYELQLAIIQGIIRRLFTAENPVRVQGTPREIYGGKTNTGRGFSESYCFPVTLHPIAVPHSIVYHLWDGQRAH
jgi:hypothetical protein